MMDVRDFEHEIRRLRHGSARDTLLYEPTCKRSKLECDFWPTANQG